MQAHAEETPDNKDRHYCGAVSLHDVQRITFKRRFRSLQDTCHAKRRRTHGIVNEAAKSGDQVVKQNSRPRCAVDESSRIAETTR